MREAQFLKQNLEKWRLYDEEIKQPQISHKLADRFVEISDDLSYSKTFYPKSNTIKYLNGLTALFHQKVYKNKREKSTRIFSFWQFDLPCLFRYYHRKCTYSLIFFLIFCFIRAISAKYAE